ncbi:hypothetical protein [Nonomuraea zeae]|uniref:Lipoprotein n=1 Tax=Nonomuraea zeae TaxID=1642303 RepID=A0A5S4GKP0_9ACTN|nr:hypothetical protein [Nonomuraea zeae]TMR33536.1 hypothetical protein ETD85_19435 [Nonomuraea zeae]
MRRVATALGLLLVVAGCGQAERPYEPKGASTPVRSSADDPASSPSKSADQAEPVEDEDLPSGPQTIRVGENLRLRIEWPANPDPLLKVMVDQYVGTRKAIAEGATVYNRNMEIEAENQSNGWIRGFVEQGQSWRGVGRLYNLRVFARRSKGAQINACIDETGIRVISTSTGKAVARQPTWLRTPYSKAVVAHRGEDGVWRIRTYLESSERCS